MGSRYAANAGRAPRSEPASRELQDRARIADLAARFIVEHGLADWSLAKRKAARQLMLTQRHALPGDDEIETALIAHQALFGGDAHAASLRRQRTEALRWMRDLASFEPVLTGGVAAGWAGEHSDIRLELVADDAKAVELALINRNVAYRAGPESPHAMTELHVDAPAGVLRLIVRTSAMARQRPRRDRHGREEPRLDADAVAELLKS
ncbi:MAG: hypothetical protein KGJ99_14465 [Betaproteobacteria bacterium]|nr:hypothetical protein [Betaproteobacteria bacterium]